MASTRRRLSTALATIVVLSGAGGLAWLGAETAATFVEDRAAQDVGQALQDGGYDWVRVRTDGLQVRLTGTAPSEVERFRAATRAATAVDGSRIVDAMTVASVAAMEAPEFKVELLRNAQGISVIGLIPAASDRDAILERLRAQAPDGQLADLLETADHPLPQGWDDALRLGLQAAELTTQSRISVAPGRVQITALATDRDQQGQLDAALRRAVPAGVTMDLQISAPRPVIAPFTLRFAIDDAGAGFATCVADDEAARQKIADAAREAGLATMPDCVLGLGAPSAEWGDAAALAIRALGQLGRGEVSLSDTEIALVAPEGVARARFDQVVGELERSVPAMFQVQAELRQPAAQPAPIEFQASLSPQGGLTMRGRIADAQMRDAVDSFARSRFDVTQSGLREDGQVPGGWTVRVVAGLEVMDALHAGTVHVSPDLITVTGMSGNPEAAERAAALLSDRLGAGVHYALAIGYDRRLDPALGLPDGEECAARLNLIMSESEVGFEPGGSAIAGDPGPTLVQLSRVMADCAEFQLEAGGHTDSQGSEEFNADLSRRRAQAIVAAMQGAGIDVTNLSARGYGESQPIATNDTEEGREANRRTEFRLLSPHPVRPETPRPPEPVTGVTGMIAPAAVASAPASDATQAGPGLEDRMLYGPQRPPEQGPMPQAVAGPPVVMGPDLPGVIIGAGVTPLTVGAQEEFETLEAREENLRVPVQTPDESTPRPGIRPDDLRPGAENQDGTAAE